MRVLRVPEPCIDFHGITYIIELGASYGQVSGHCLTGHIQSFPDTLAPTKVAFGPQVSVSLLGLAGLTILLEYL